MFFRFFNSFLVNSSFWFIVFYTISMLEAVVFVLVKYTLYIIYDRHNHFDMLQVLSVRLLVFWRSHTHIMLAFKLVLFGIWLRELHKIFNWLIYFWEVLCSFFLSFFSSIFFLIFLEDFTVWYSKIRGVFSFLWFFQWSICVFLFLIFKKYWVLWLL